MKVVEAAFNQEKALVGAFSVIVQLRRLIVTALVLAEVGLGAHQQPRHGRRVVLQLGHPVVPHVVQALDQSEMRVGVTCPALHQSELTWGETREKQRRKTSVPG